ncbi:MAG: hypothetical protein RLZZ156_488 [Deinococcota bacterium]|jgi:tetratricopeptide (TPR) repeat protein
MKITPRSLVEKFSTYIKSNRIKQAYRYFDDWLPFLEQRAEWHSIRTMCDDLPTSMFTSRQHAIHAISIMETGSQEYGIALLEQCDKSLPVTAFGLMLANMRKGDFESAKALYFSVMADEMTRFDRLRLIRMFMALSNKNLDEYVKDCMVDKNLTISERIEVLLILKGFYMATGQSKQNFLISKEGYHLALEAGFKNRIMFFADTYCDFLSVTKQLSKLEKIISELHKIGKYHLPTKAHANRLSMTMEAKKGNKERSKIYMKVYIDTGLIGSSDEINLGLSRIYTSLGDFEYAHHLLKSCKRLRDPSSKVFAFIAFHYQKREFNQIVKLAKDFDFCANMGSASDFSDWFFYICALFILKKDIQPELRKFLNALTNNELLIEEFFDSVEMSEVTLNVLRFGVEVGLLTPDILARKNRSEFMVIDLSKPSSAFLEDGVEKTEIHFAFNKMYEIIYFLQYTGKAKVSDIAQAIYGTDSLSAKNSVRNAISKTNKLLSSWLGKALILSNSGSYYFANDLVVRTRCDVILISILGQNIVDCIETYKRFDSVYAVIDSDWYGDELVRERNLLASLAAKIGMWQVQTDSIKGQQWFNRALELDPLNEVATRGLAALNIEPFETPLSFVRSLN